MDPIVVVGGGIVGTSVAYHLRTADRRVVLLERGDLAGGTTGASAGQFTYHQSEPDPDVHALRAAARNWYARRIAAGDLSFDPVGTLHVAGSETEMAAVADLASGLVELGVETVRLDAAELPDYGIAAGPHSAGLLLPDDGRLDAVEVTRHQATVAREAGVTVETGVPATDVRVEDGSVTGVETPAGTYPAGTVVNAAGPWAPRLDDRVGVSLPLRHTLGPIVAFAPAEPVRTPLTFLENRRYVRGDGDRILVGSFATAHDEATERDPDDVPPVSDEDRDVARETARRYLHAPGPAEATDEWQGLRTVTPDGNPIVGRVGPDGYVVASGMSGYGVTIAPAVGRLVADLILDGEARDGVPGGERVSPDRF